jgi:hypothetical protein
LENKVEHLISPNALQIGCHPTVSSAVGAAKSTQINYLRASRRNHGGPCIRWSGLGDGTESKLALTVRSQLTKYRRSQAAKPGIPWWEAQPMVPLPAGFTAKPQGC